MIDGDGNRTALDAVAVNGLLDWSAAFAVPDGAPFVEVSFDSSARSRWLVLQGIVLLALVVMALPERRRVDPDPDLDGPEASEGSAIATSLAPGEAEPVVAPDATSVAGPAQAVSSGPEERP